MSLRSSSSPRSVANDISIIPQLFSWGQLQISREAFQRILACHQVFTPFLHVVNEFGSKIRHESPNSNTSFVCSHMNISSPFKIEVDRRTHRGYGEKIITISMSTNNCLELCYILRFVEKNGRTRGDPWSLRQTGVYQQVNSDSRKSTWIFLQLSQDTKAALKEVLKNQSTYFDKRDSPMALHTFLLATVDNWGEYIQDLSKQLTCVVRWIISR